MTTSLTLSTPLRIFDELSYILPHLTTVFLLCLNPYGIYTKRISQEANHIMCKINGIWPNFHTIKCIFTLEICSDQFQKYTV